MSSTKRNRNHKAKPETAHYTINLLAKSHDSQSFEEKQLQHLQTMIEHLAASILSAMKDQKNQDDQAQIPPMRLYAQYLNLYMKFKDKCFKEDAGIPKKSQQITQANTQQDAKPNPLVNTTLNAPSAVLHPTHDNSGKLANQIQDAVKQVKNNHDSNRLHQINHTTRLMMQPIQDAISKR